MAKKITHHTHPHANAHAHAHAGHSERHKRMNRAKIYLIAAVLGIVFFPSFVKYQELSYKNRRLEEKINALSLENRRLEDEKRRLETDITYIEKRARDEIGVARKGEIVLKGSAEADKRGR